MAVLRDVVAAPELVNELDATEKADFLNAAGDVFCPDPEIRRRRTKLLQQQRRSEKSQRDDETLAETGIRTLRSRPVFTTPDVYAPDDFEQRDVDDDPAAPPFRETIEPQHCYICKVRYREIHHFYDQLCPDCAALNFAKRGELADMSGMVVLLTGGRVKIGYQAGIKLLRCGAELIVATRFPRDAAERYAAEPDFAEWGDRLEVFGLDLRHTPSVEAFCAHLLATRTRLDAIINNACQTVRRPPAFYEHMMDNETAALGALPPEVLRLVGSYESLRGGARSVSCGTESESVSVPATGRHRAPRAHPCRRDVAGGAAARRPADDRLAVSRRAARPGPPTGRSPRPELVAPADARGVVGRAARDAARQRGRSVRAQRPPQAADGGHTRRDHKHIVNVSAVEGQFYRPRKTTKHPHTNMAKAALNMMTRTSATDYHDAGINMNSVDTGWVSDEDPVAIAEAKTAEHRFHPPLDIVDGAARIVDPLIHGLNTGDHVWGQFLKDYAPTDW